MSLGLCPNEATSDMGREDGIICCTCKAAFYAAKIRHGTTSLPCFSAFSCSCRSNGACGGLQES